MNNYLPHPFEEAEEENSLICCREDFGWILGITFTPARETLRRRSPGSYTTSVTKEQLSCSFRMSHVSPALPRSTSAGIPPSPMVL